MRRILFVLTIFLAWAGISNAQAPVITYLQADEAKSQLQIHGVFPNDPTGSVKIEDTVVSVRSWSDTLVICDLPDSGKGIGGHVQVSQMQGISNVRILSIFHLRISSGIFLGSSNGWHLLGYNRWYINWRFDIGGNSGYMGQTAFEVSKTSLGWIFNFPPVPWADSSSQQDSSMSCYGSIDPINHFVIIENDVMRASGNFGPHSVSYVPSPLKYDSTGYVKGYRIAGTGSPEPVDDSVSGYIQFPPSPKDAVHSTENSSSNNISVHFLNSSSSLSISSTEAVGSTITSLYSIDGRILRRETIEINSPGEYRFDVSGVGSAMGFLVLSTPKEIITKKVIF